MKREDVRADPKLRRNMDAKQFGLKLIANVTYGYTSASYSGRMPCAELADTIVQTGRDTLEDSKRVIDQHPSWNAQVSASYISASLSLVPAKTGPSTG